MSDFDDEEYRRLVAAHREHLQSTVEDHESRLRILERMPIINSIDIEMRLRALEKVKYQAAAIATIVSVLFSALIAAFAKKFIGG